MFSQKNWNNKNQYIQAFTLSNWKKLSSQQKSSHTLSKCIACYTESEPLQTSFPLEPVYIPDSSIVVTKGPEKLVARKLLKDMNRQWEREFGHTLKHYPSYAQWLT